jgi:hypothetical protein
MIDFTTLEQEAGSRGCSKWKGAFVYPRQLHYGHCMFPTMHRPAPRCNLTLRMFAVSVDHEVKQAVASVLY